MNVQFSTAIASRPIHLRMWETKLAVYKVLLWGLMSLFLGMGCGSYIAKARNGEDRRETPDGYEHIKEKSLTGDVGMYTNRLENTCFMNKLEMYHT